MWIRNIFPYQPSPSNWLNRTVIGVGLTSLFSDWSHEIATAVLPAFLATIGAGPAWLGAIEGISGGLSSFTTLAAGHYTDRWKKRKPIAVFGYAFTALATGSFAFAPHAWLVMLGRAAAWLGRGVRSPAKKALLAADVAPQAYGRAFGLERLMDTVGAIAGPLTARWLLKVTHNSYRTVFLWTLLPGMIAVACFWFLVRERPMERRQKRSFLTGLRNLPTTYRKFLFAVSIFGSGDYSHTLLILFATRMLAPAHGMARAASLAVGLYTLHNVFSAGSSYLSGWISNHVPDRKFILAAGYALAGVNPVDGWPNFFFTFGFHLYSCWTLCGHGSRSGRFGCGGVNSEGTARDGFWNPRGRQCGWRFSFQPSRRISLVRGFCESSVCLTRRAFFSGCFPDTQAARAIVWAQLFKLG